MKKIKLQMVVCIFNYHVFYHLFQPPIPSLRPSKFSAPVCQLTNTIVHVSPPSLAELVADETNGINGISNSESKKGNSLTESQNVSQGVAEKDVALDGCIKNDGCLHASASTQDGEVLKTLNENGLSERRCFLRSFKDTGVQITPVVQTTTAAITTPPLLPAGVAITSSAVDHTQSDRDVHTTDKKQRVAIPKSRTNQSCANMLASAGRFSSIYRGVTKHRSSGRFEAHYWDSCYERPADKYPEKSLPHKTKRSRGRQVYCGAYSSEMAAARAYDKVALAYSGDAAALNVSSTSKLFSHPN